MQKGVRMTLIHDVTPPSKQQFDTVEEKPAIQRFTSDTLINELWRRGVPIHHIFGRYYELEAITDAIEDDTFGSDERGQHGRPKLTVADAELAGVAALPDKPSNRQPF